MRGPDLLWGGDIHRFHPPAYAFRGIIGGPPCQAFSRLIHIVKAKGQTPKPNLIPEFERCVSEAQPHWFVMENVPDAPTPDVPYYTTSSQLIRDVWVGGETSRQRRFTFGALQSLYSSARFHIETLALHSLDPERAVVATSSKEGALAKSQGELRTGISTRLKKKAAALPGQMPRREFERCCELQGLPRDFLKDAPFTSAGKYQAVGNGVPLAMGRAVAAAVLHFIQNAQVAA